MELSHKDQPNILRLGSGWIGEHDSGFTQLTNDIITRVRQLQTKSNELVTLGEKNTELLTALQMSVERLGRAQTSTAGHREMAEAVLQTVAHILDRAEDGIGLMQATVRREYAEGYVEVMRRTSELQREIGALLGESPEDMLQTPEDIEARTAEFFREAGNSVLSISTLLQNLVAQQEARLSNSRRSEPRRQTESQETGEVARPWPPATATIGIVEPAPCPPVYDQALKSVDESTAAPEPRLEIPIAQHTVRQAEEQEQEEGPSGVLVTQAGIETPSLQAKEQAEPELAPDAVAQEPAQVQPVVPVNIQEGQPVPDSTEAISQEPGADLGPQGAVASPALDAAPPVEPSAAPAAQDDCGLVAGAPDYTARAFSIVEALAEATPEEELEVEPATQVAQVVASSFDNLAAMTAFSASMRQLPGVVEVRATGFNQGTLQLRVEMVEGAVLPSLLLTMPQFETRLLHLSTECVRITVRARRHLAGALRSF